MSLILTLALAGCVRSGVPSPIGTSAPSPHASPQPVAEFSLTYQRSGGSMGTDDTWTIDPQGRITHQGSDKSAQLTAAQQADLVAAVHAANFMALEDSYVPKGICCDRYEYTITLTANSQSKTVHTLDGSPTAPPELTQLVTTLNRLPGPLAQ